MMGGSVQLAEVALKLVMLHDSVSTVICKQVQSRVRVHAIIHARVYLLKLSCRPGDLRCKEPGRRAELRFPTL